MISTFDLTKLNALLKDFYTLTHIRITVFDETFRELAAYPEQIAPFCRIIRTDSHAALNCKMCDRHACETAAGRRTAYTYRCHAGLTESIVPLYQSSLLIGYLFFGHVFPYETHEDGWESIEALCKPYHLDMDALKSCLPGTAVNFKGLYHLCFSYYAGGRFLSVSGKNGHITSKGSSGPD